MLVHGQGVLERENTALRRSRHRWKKRLAEEIRVGRRIRTNMAEQFRLAESELKARLEQSSHLADSRLATIKGLVRFTGRELHVKGVKQVQAPIDVLTGRELGRLMAAIEGHRWGAE